MSIVNKLFGSKGVATRSARRAAPMFETLETRALYSASIHPVLERTSEVGSHFVVSSTIPHTKPCKTTQAAALPVPTVLSPGTTHSSGMITTGTTPTFTWDAVTTGINGFRLNLYDVTVGKFTTYTTGASATSFTLPTALHSGHSFVWNLRVIDGSRTGTESAYLYFQTAAPVAPTTLPIPTVISPGTNNSAGKTVTSTTPTFTWTSATKGITGFQLNLYNITTKQFVSYQIAAGATSFTVPSELPSGDSFVWNFRVVDGTATGIESAYLYFQTAAPAPVVPVTPAKLPVPTVIGPGVNNSAGTTVTSTTPTFTWTSGTAGITGFQLNLYDITSKKFVSYQTAASATSFTVPTALASGDSFVWNLRVVDGSVTGTESAYLYFQTGK